MSKELTFNEKVALFKKTAQSAKARKEYARSRASVILPLIDEQSTIRNIFNPEILPPGAQSNYDIPFDDVDCAWVMPQIGGIPQIQVEGTEIYVTTFGLDAAVEYQMDVARQGRFQVGERATKLLKNKIIEQEELAGWSLIQAHAAALDSSQKVATTSGLDTSTFNKIVTAGDVLRRKVTDIYVSPTRYADIRDWVANVAYTDKVRDNIFGSGELAGLWDVRIHKVYNSELVSDDKGYAFGQRDGYTYGVMPIRQTLQTYDNPISIMQWKIGIMARENLGFGILDDKGLVEVSFNDA